jgi:hypothetical protein
MKKGDTVLVLRCDSPVNKKFVGRRGVVISNTSARGGCVRVYFAYKFSKKRGPTIAFEPYKVRLITVLDELAEIAES